MDAETRRVYKDRVELVLKNLRNCNSGTEAHQVGNMRNRAGLLLDEIEEPDSKATDVLPILCRLEEEQLAFFKKKFNVVK